jgi:protease I
MGGVYTDQDVVIDGDLITARTGGHCHLFARAIIDMLIDKEDSTGTSNGPDRVGGLHRAAEPGTRGAAAPSGARA